MTEPILGILRFMVAIAAAAAIDANARIMLTISVPGPGLREPGMLAPVTERNRHEGVPSIPCLRMRLNLSAAPMSAFAEPPPHHPRDPIGWTSAITLVFLALCLVRLTVPTKPFFDEVHYLPAARALLGLTHLANPEHPPLGKELIALGIALFGDGPIGWRIFSALFGVLGLFAAMRALWFASGSRFAALAFGVLLATGFPLLVQARIAMLDGFMASFTLVGLWMCAGAVRENETARWRLAIAGAAFGCAMACKWNAIPLAVLPGVVFLVIRARSAGMGLVAARRGPPIGGMTLAEAAIWLGALPLAVYALTFWPTIFSPRTRSRRPACWRCTSAC